MAQEPVLEPDHPLAGCDAKLRRAHENFVLVENGITQFMDSHPPPIAEIGVYDNHTKRIVWRVTDTVEPDLLLAALIGDFIHDLRSALDHLAFELSFLDTDGVIPDRFIAYPCCRSKSEWRSRKVRVEKLRGINQAHRAMIYKTQPCYRRADDAAPATVKGRKRHALADLQNFWDHDKHRSLQPLATAPAQIHGKLVGLQHCKPRGGLHMGETFLGQPLRRGDTCFWLPIWPNGPEPTAELQITLGIRMCFDNGLPAIYVLGNIGNWVTSLIESFIPAFETPKARRLWGIPRGGWIHDSPLRQTRHTVKTDDIPADWL